MLFHALRLLVPALWLGLIIGISVIETPLKFQAPGITLPIGLGIGRIVFTAMNIVEGVFAIILLIAVFVSRPRLTEWLLSLAVVGVLAAKALIIRPALGTTTDAVMEGTSAGGSGMHVVYVAAEGVLIVLLVWLMIATARSLLRHPQRGSSPDDAAADADAAER